MPLRKWGAWRLPTDKVGEAGYAAGLSGLYVPYGLLSRRVPTWRSRPFSCAALADKWSTTSANHDACRLAPLVLRSEVVTLSRGRVCDSVVIVLVNLVA